jgi:hypothetical protein
MRRIMERTVTIVTTTIWKISWHEDARANPDLDDHRKPEGYQEVVQHTRQFPTVIEGKEVNVSVTEPATKQTADVPPDDSYFYQSKKGNEKP